MLVKPSMTPFTQPAIFIQLWGELAPSGGGVGGREREGGTEGEEEEEEEEGGREGTRGCHTRSTRYIWDIRFC